MSTMHSGSENPTDLPRGWREIGDGKWRHETGVTVRIHHNIPLRSAADFNVAKHSELQPTTFEVLYHELPLPSRPEEVATGFESEAAARERAIDTMRRRP